MRKLLESSVKHPLISGSFVLFFGSIVANLFNFLFNLFMSRNLSVGDFGVLASTTSLVLLPAMMAGSTQPAIVNFAAGYFAKKEYGKVRSLFFKVEKFLFPTGLILFLLYAVFSSQIGLFFKINNSLLITFVGLSVFLSFISSINGFLLQAKLDFNFITWTSIIGACLKLFLGILFVSLGLSVLGAFGAFFIASLVVYILSFIPLRFIFSGMTMQIPIDAKKILFYGFPAAITLVSLNSFIMSDIMIVKHLMDPKTAGLYAGISLVGRVIFFLTAPIGIVMFPLIVQKLEKNEEYNSIFRLAIFIILIPSIFITTFYVFFPEFSIIFFLKKIEYLAAISSLVPFAIFITIYSLNVILVNFFLSVKKTNVSVPILFTAILQIILIWIFHRTLQEVIYSSISVSILLLIFLLLFYLKHYGKRNQ